MAQHHFGVVAVRANSCHTQNVTAIHRARQRDALLASAVLLVLVLSGCAGVPGENSSESVSSPAPSSTASGSAEDLRVELTQLPGVDAVIGGAEGLTVEMPADVSLDDVLATTAKAHALATDARFPADIWITRIGGGYSPELDVATPPPWTFPVYPGEIETTLGTVAGVLDVEGIAGTSAITVVDGWPYVTIANVAEFASVFDAVSATALFANGGTYSTGSDHLQIVHVPTRTSAEAIHAIVEIAANYPTAEVLLQATTAGPQWPQLYVARLSADEAAAIDARLRSAELADTDPDGHPQRFQLSVIGSGGPVYTIGTFGNVPG